MTKILTLKEIRRGSGQVQPAIQGHGDAESGRSGERIQTGIEPTPEFKRLNSSISGVLHPWDLCRERLRVFFDNPHKSISTARLHSSS